MLKQINIRLEDTEYEDIVRAAQDRGLTIKGYILQGLKDPKKTLEEKRAAQAQLERMKTLSQEDGKSPPSAQVLEAISEAHGLLGGFSIKTFGDNLRNFGLREMDLSDADLTAILLRYKEHANYWNYRSDKKREELEALGEALKCEDPS